MFSTHAGRTMVLILSLAAVPAFATRTHHSVSSSRTRASLSHATLKHRAGRLRKAVVAKIRGQRQIDPQRATQIQEALIRENYLTGSPSGQWDSETETAMLKYQADHGWQTKLTPDSRALIKLGLGPNPSYTATPNGDATHAVEGGGASEAGTLASVHSISQ